jgi:asparagine synthase (glutamine-hydrolysing)
MLFGWASEAPEDLLAGVGGAMGEALRVRATQRWSTWTLPGLVIGAFQLSPFESADMPVDSLEPARAGDEWLWFGGEAFNWSSHGLSGPRESQTPAFRARLLEAITRRGEEVLGHLDGEWQIALWNGASRTLRVWTDRFASRPVYWSQNSRGSAFAGGVRGVLAVPGVAIEPDPEALRDAVSFGGFRLGDRTNIRAVSMAPPAASLTLTHRDCRVRRYWTWQQLDCTPATDTKALLDRTRHAWSEAIRRRLEGSRRPGLTLSGGLDSRAILAEAVRQRGAVHALTYGVAGCDDVLFAERAARAVAAPWTHYALYQEGWLDRRIRHIGETDGLMELVDLMHAEAFESMPAAFDTLLSGYIGDLVSGATYAHVTTPEHVLGALPYYGGRLAFSAAAALQRVESAVAETPGPAKFALYDHKLRQAIGRISDAARPYACVRRPFLDHDVFETAHRIPDDVRRDHRWHEQWLLSTYPECFRRIPNQRTAAPVGASRMRRQAVRVSRYAWRRAAAWATRLGVTIPAPQRSFHPDERYWQAPSVRDVIEGAILRPGSLCCEILGRQPVAATLSEFFSTGAAPVQVVGAMFVYERYHQTVSGFLAEAHAKATEMPC